MKDLENLDLDADIQPSNYCVPSRWELSGFRYVQIDPKEQKYFNSPNKINGAFGMGADDPRRDSLKCESDLLRSNHRSSFGAGIGPDYESTYD